MTEDTEGSPGSGTLAEPERRGSTEIADRVVERIAAQAVGEVDGAHGTARRVLGVATPGGAGQAAPKVAVQVDGQLATVRLTMSVRYPAPIRQVTRRVRDHVVVRVGELTGLQVRHVDIDIPALISPVRHGSRVQ
jgi:uncharacterized alkaline shock family protein YloU